MPQRGGGTSWLLLLCEMHRHQVGGGNTIAQLSTHTHITTVDTGVVLNYFFSAMVAPWHGADGHPCFRTASKTWRLAVG
jgi:hypothetical protein